MSDSWQGPGWWKAQDGKWYPPELHPTGSPSNSKPPSSRSTAVTVLAGIGLLTLLFLGGCFASAVLLARSSGDVFDQLEELDAEFGPDGPFGGAGPVVVELDRCGEGEVPFTLTASGVAFRDPNFFGEPLPEVVDIEFDVQFLDGSGSPITTFGNVLEGVRSGDDAAWTGTTDGRFDEAMTCNVTNVRWVE